MQLLMSGFDSRHRHVAGKCWWSGLFRSGKRNGIGTVEFDLPLRITCIFSPVVGKVSHSRKWRMIYGQLENWPSCWNQPIWKNRPSCVLHNYYIQTYINLCLVISPSRPPSSHIYLWNIFRSPQTRLLSLLQVHI